MKPRKLESIPSNPMSNITASSDGPNRLQVGQEQNRNLEEIIAKGRTRIPSNGFKIYSPILFNEAVQLVHIWNQANTEFLAVKDSQKLPDAHRKLYGTISKIVRFPKPYSLDSFDELFTEVVSDRLAERGVVLSSFHASRHSLNNDYYIYTQIYDFVWLVQSIGQKQIKLVDGKDKPFTVCHIIPWPKLEKSTGGFAGYGTIFINENDSSRADKSMNSFKLQLLTAEPLLSSSDIFKFLEQMNRETPATNPADHLLRSLSYSRYRILCIELAELNEEEKITTYHEAQHLDDYKHKITKTAILFNVDEETFSEFRARTNELQASPRIRFYTMLNILTRPHFKDIEAHQHEKQIKIKGFVNTEYITLQAITKLVLSDPKSFGIEIREHPFISPEAQIYGQLDKLVYKPNPERILAGLQPLLADRESLLSQLDLNETFYRLWLKPKLEL